LVSSNNTTRVAVIPCVTAFRHIIDLPRAVFGPVLFNAFNRFALIFASLVIALAPFSLTGALVERQLSIPLFSLAEQKAGWTMSCRVRGGGGTARRWVPLG
jgi:hypothetical protein